MTTEGPVPPEENPDAMPPPPEQPPESAPPPPPPSPATEPVLTPPNLGQPVPPATQPGATPPNLGGQPPREGMSGCAKAAIIGGVIIVVVGVAVVALLIFGVMRFADEVDESFSEEPCRFITNEEASDVIGTQVEATSGDSAVGAILGLVRDTRLLEDSASCFITSDDSSIQVWISVHDGADAAEVFAAQADIADGQIVTQETTETGTITVESEAFRGSDVPGLGEEAFCTEVGMVASGGVLARSDDRVVYVSALALEENQGAEVFTAELCERAVPIAEVLLG